MTESVIQLRGVAKKFGEQMVLRSIDLDIEQGETFVMLGPSGCGKTTTLRLMNGLETPSSGEVRVLDQDVVDADLDALRRQLGYVIQDVGLFAHMTVAENISVVPTLLGWERRRISKRVDECLSLMRLEPADYKDRYPHQLSGGQRQRVGVARALAGDPPVILMDEPFGALDPITREQLQDEFLVLRKKLKKTFVLVTHDLFEAVRLGDRVAVMQGGEIVACDTPPNLLQGAAHKFVEELFGRHRYHLQLLTTPLSDLLEDAPEVTTEREEPIMDASQSVWDALELMARKKAKSVNVSKKRLKRDKLLE